MKGSRQFKAFDDYLLPKDKFQNLLQHQQLPISIDTDCTSYLHHRLDFLRQQLTLTNKLAKTDNLPDASITANKGLQVTPLDAVTPESAQILITKVTSMLPTVKITELLLEVDEWTGFSNEFTHIKTMKSPKTSNYYLPLS